MILKDKFAEITLLPGTKLELVQKATSRDGTLFAEYEVTANPPPFTDEEAANILRDAITMRVSEQLPAPLLPTKNEQMQFLFDLVNEKYVRWPSVKLAAIRPAPLALPLTGCTAGNAARLAGKLVVRSATN